VSETSWGHEKEGGGSLEFFLGTREPHMKCRSVSVAGLQEGGPTALWADFRGGQGISESDCSRPAPSGEGFDEQPRRDRENWQGESPLTPK
jgi:hypothetical protein